jgi:homocysteine S-methyltransferase
MSYDIIREKLERGDLVVLDGAVGTEILRRDITWADHQVIKRPDAVRQIHQDYIEGGADVISTNTFQLTRRALFNHFRDEDHWRHVGAPDLPGRADQLLRAATRLAVEAREASGKRVAIAGCITTIEWCFRPDLSPDFEAARGEYRETMTPLAEAGCDLILCETVNSVQEARAAATAASDVGIPIWMAFVPTESGELFSGESMADAANAMAQHGVDVVLLNCAPPDDCTAGLTRLADARYAANGIYPHVGRFDPPEWMFTDEYPPDRYVTEAHRWRDLGAAVIGGCCGTTPDHIAAVAREAR